MSSLRPTREMCKVMVFHNLKELNFGIAFGWLKYWVFYKKIYGETK